MQSKTECSLKSWKFGGPERAEDVIPFLENVVRGRGVARGRLLEVAEHYYSFGGGNRNGSLTNLISVT